jgi:exopolysaccharide production protein ExoQ
MASGVTSSHAHNGYLDVILDLGFLGLILTGLFLLSCAAKASRTFRSDPDWGVLFFGILVMATVHNIAESTVNSLTSSLTAVILFFSVAILASPAEADAVDVAAEPSGGLA